MNRTVLLNRYNFETGTLIIIERQPTDRPKVRKLPEKLNGKQQQSKCGDRSFDGDASDQYREGSRKRTDKYRDRRITFQRRVYKGICNEGNSSQQSSQCIEIRQE